MPKAKPTTKLLGSTIDPVFTTEPVAAPKGDLGVRPIWISLPQSGERCSWTSLSRSALNALILGKNPVVKSVSLRQTYALRGKRLIHLQSLLDYIEGVATAQGNQPTEGGERHA